MRVAESVGPACELLGELVGALVLCEFLRSGRQGEEGGRFLREGCSVLEETFEKLASLFGLGQFEIEVIAKSAVVGPAGIAERTVAPVEEVEPLLEEGAGLEGGAEGRVGLQAIEVGENDANFSAGRGRKRSSGDGEGLQVAQSRGFVERGFGGDGGGQARGEFAGWGEFGDGRESECDSAGIDGREDGGIGEVGRLEVALEVCCDGVEVLRGG